MLIALRQEQPDRLPAAVHQWQPYHLNKYLGGIDDLTAFRRFGLDASIPCFPASVPDSAEWREEVRTGPAGDGRTIEHHVIHAPGGQIRYKVERHAVTAWVTEHLVKHPEDVDLIDRYMPIPRLDKAAVAAAYDRLGDDGILRGFVGGFRADAGRTPRNCLAYRT